MSVPGGLPQLQYALRLLDRITDPRDPQELGYHITIEQLTQIRRLLKATEREVLAHGNKP